MRIKFFNCMGIRTVVACFLVLSGAVNSEAQNLGLDPSRDIAQYALRVWTKKQGLPQNSVHALTQTRDGYLWLGTEEGLVRFNGAEFKVFTKVNSGIPHNFIYCLYESRDGALWVGTYRGLAVFNGGKFTSYTVDHGLPSNGITSILQTGDSRIWVGTDKGLCYFEDGKIFIVEGVLSKAPIITLESNQNEELFIGSTMGLFIQSYNKLTPYGGSTTDRKHIRALLSEPDGSLWVGIRGQGLLQLDSHARVMRTFRDGLFQGINWSLLRDTRNALWVGTNGGLVRIYGHRVEQFTYRDGLSSDEILSLYQDHEGNLWVGTSGGGLNCITNGKFVTYPTGISPSQNFAFTVSEDYEGTLWTGNAMGQVLVLHQGQFTAHPAFLQMSNTRVYSVLNDSVTGLWVGMGDGLYRYQHGLKTRVSIEGNGNLNVRALYRGRTGEIWIGTLNGLYRFVEGTYTLFNSEDGLPSPNVRVVREDRRGDLWVGGRFGLYQRREGIFYPIVTSIDSSAIPFDSIVADDDGIIWAGSFGFGIFRIKEGSVFRYTQAQGLFDNTAYEIIDDGLGNLWMSCNNGVYRVSKQSLNDVAEGRAASVACVSYGDGDGMKSSECNGTAQPSAWKSSDGKLWFSTIAGVAMVDPRNIPTNSIIPPVLIEDIFVDRELIEQSIDLSIPPGYNEIEFNFACLSFRSPASLQYRYQLVGYDRGWVDGGQRRFAVYSNLSPGKYQFRVKAANDDGVWNEIGASRSFELQPFFYQTQWFYGLVSVLLVVLGAGAQRLYQLYRQRKVLANHLQAQVARAQLQALRSQLNPHFLFNTLNAISGLIMHSPRMAVKMMARLSDFLRLTIDTELIQKIPLCSELESLKKYVEIEELRLGNRLTIEYVVSSNVQNSLVPSLLLQPLVENAIRHGISKKTDCGLIRIHAAAHQARLHLEVFDDGLGFQVPGNGHNRAGVGLANTKARLQELYGRNQSMHIKSSPGQGTRIAISIPLEHQSVSELEVA